MNKIKIHKELELIKIIQLGIDLTEKFPQLDLRKLTQEYQTKFGMSILKSETLKNSIKEIYLFTIH